jgi:hypothetical protein
MLITNVGYNFTYRWNISAQQLIDKIKFGKSLLPNSRTLINISRGEINLCTYKIQNDICMILEEVVEDRWRPLHTVAQLGKDSPGSTFIFGLFGYVPLQFSKLGDIPLQFIYLQPYHYNSIFV